MLAILTYLTSTVGGTVFFGFLISFLLGAKGIFDLRNSLSAILGKNHHKPNDIDSFEISTLGILDESRSGEDTLILKGAAAIALSIVFLWLSLGLLAYTCPLTKIPAVNISDAFALSNGLFSGFALAGVIVAIFLQKLDLSLQRRELRLSTSVLSRQAQLMKDQARLQGFAAIAEYWRNALSQSSNLAGKSAICEGKLRHYELMCRRLVEHDVQMSEVEKEFSVRAIENFVLRIRKWNSWSISEIENQKGDFLCLLRDAAAFAPEIADTELRRVLSQLVFHCESYDAALPATVWEHHLAEIGSQLSEQLT
jgi:hypothetical protein